MTTKNMHSDWEEELRNLERWKKEDEEYHFGNNDQEPIEIMMDIKDTVAEARKFSEQFELPQVFQDLREHIWDREFSEGLLEQYSDQEIEKEWLDHLLAFNEREGDYQSKDKQFSHLYRQNGNWRGYRGSPVDIPQGWKIHISAEPETGLEVLETVQPYLQENGVDHKVRDSVKTVKRKLDDGQPDRAHKFFTIYPDANPEMLVDGEQTFEPESIVMNRNSMTANQERTEEVMEELYQLLNDEDLLEGPEINGRNGSEVQVGNTRIHFRYGKITAGIEPTVVGGREQVVDTDGLFDPTINALDEDCEQIQGYTHPDDIDGIEYISTPEGTMFFY